MFSRISNCADGVQSLAAGHGGGVKSQATKSYSCCYWHTPRDPRDWLALLVVLVLVLAATIRESHGQFLCALKTHGCGLIQARTSHNLNISFNGKLLMSYRITSAPVILASWRMNAVQTRNGAYCTVTILTEALQCHALVQPSPRRYGTSLDVTRTSQASRFISRSATSYFYRDGHLSNMSIVASPSTLPQHLGQICFMKIDWLLLGSGCALALPADANCSHKANSRAVIAMSSPVGWECQCDYGLYDRSGTCRSCSCHYGRDCDRKTGKCICGTEFVGPNCICRKCKNEGTAVVTQQHNRVIGCECLCRAGFTGYTCETPVTCPSLSVPPNARLLKPADRSYLGRTVTECVNGTVLVRGQLSRVCQHNATWSGSAAVCQNVSADQLLCEAETLNTTRGLFLWPATPANTTRSFPCPFILRGQQVASATRLCAFSGPAAAAWKTANISLCSFTSARTRELQTLASSIEQNLQMASAKTVLSVSQNLQRLTADSGPNSDELNDDDVVFAANSLSQVAAAASAVFNTSSPPTTSYVENIVESLVKVSGNLADSIGSTADSSSRLMTSDSVQMTSSAAGSSVARSLETVGVAVPVVTANQQLSAQSENIALLALCPDARSSYQLTVSSSTTVRSNLASSNFTLQPAREAPDGFSALNQSLVSFAMPAEALDKATGFRPRTPTECARARASFVIYNSADLFQSESNSSQGTLVSSVVSARAGEEDGRIQLNASQIEVRFLVNVSESAEPRFACVFWDFQSSQWRSDGCTLVSVSSVATGRMASCRCNHLTNFGLLVRPPSASSALTGKHGRALSIISYIGCSISAVCLAATCITILSFRNLRQRLRQKLTFFVSLSLICSLLLFTVSSSASSSVHSCRTVGILLHYFLLVSFCWMSTQAILLYKQLVIVFDTTDDNFFIYCFVSCFSLPALVVVITASVTKFAAYNARDSLCFLATDAAFYGSFLAPVLLFVLLNTTVAVCVTYIVNRARLSTSKQKESGSMLQHSLFLARVLVSLSILVGVTWLLAALVPFIDGVTVQYFFAIFNSLQGAFIFFFYTLTSEEVRSSWAERYSSFKSEQLQSTIRQASRLLSHSGLASQNSTSVRSTRGVSEPMMDQHYSSVDSKSLRASTGDFNAATVSFCDPSSTSSDILDQQSSSPPVSPVLTAPNGSGSQNLSTSCSLPASANSGDGGNVSDVKLSTAKSLHVDAISSSSRPLQVQPSSSSIKRHGYVPHTPPPIPLPPSSSHHVSPVSSCPSDSRLAVQSSKSATSGAFRSEQTC